MRVGIVKSTSRGVISSEGEGRVAKIESRANLSRDPSSSAGVLKLNTRKNELIKRRMKPIAEKKSPKDPFGEFTKTLERQRKEMEKLAKPFFEYPKHMEKMVKPFWDYQQRTKKVARPILEYHQKLLEEAKRFQEAWVQNVVEVIGKVVNQIMEERRKQVEEGNKLLSEANLPTHVKEYIQNLQKVHERWMEQLKRSAQMLEGFVRTK